jgi:hypothetical protein
MCLCSSGNIVVDLYSNHKCYHKMHARIEYTGGELAAFINIRTPIFHIGITNLTYQTGLYNQHI